MRFPRIQDEIDGTSHHDRRETAATGADEILRCKRFLHVLVEACRKGQLTLQGTALCGQGNGGNPRLLVAAGAKADIMSIMTYTGCER